MNIFFSGIGGVALGPLSQIAHDAGYTVVGSDVEAGLMTDKLIADNVVVHIGPQDGSFLQSTHDQTPIDWFVYTAALPSDHPELVLAKQLGIRTAKRDELVAFIIGENNLKLIAVSGTHGKTTTTGMLIWVFEQLGIPVSYSIGTTLTFGPSGKYVPGSEYFIYECDEFDRNFLHFYPHIAVIPSIDYDHSDTFATPVDYDDAFAQFASQSEHVIAWNDQRPEIFNGMNNVTLLDAQTQIDETLHVHGEHNRRNGTLVEQVLLQLQITEPAKDAIARFPGTDRRFEKLAENLYSDYGHHPVEIAATLQLARELSDHVVLVYQPHQNIRQHELLGVYHDEFELADDVYWLPTYLSREDPNLRILSPDELITSITNKGHIHVADFNDELWGIIEAARNEGKLVLGMGAGAIDGWLRSRLA